MEKNLDHWVEIAALINKDKKKALDDFRAHEFVPGALPVRGTMTLCGRKPVLRPMIMAAAASIFLVAGLTFFWMLSGSWHGMSTAPVLGQLLADSFLYNIGSGPEAKAPEPRTGSSFFPVFSAWGEEAGLKRTATPAAESVEPSLTVEHGDPAAVHRKMKKVIRENTLERMLIRYCQICKEV